MANRLIRCTLLGATLGVVAIAQAQSVIRGVETQTVPGGIEIKIHGDKLAKPKEITAFGGKSYLLEFDANLLGIGKKLNVNQAGLSYVQYNWFKPRPPKVRVHLRLTAVQKPILVQSDTGWTVVLGSIATPTRNTIDGDQQAMINAVALFVKPAAKSARNDLQAAILMPSTPPQVKGAVETAPKPTISNSDANDLQQAIALLEEEQRRAKAGSVVAGPPKAAGFPETVPPLEPSPFMQRGSGLQMVSLDFVNTDIVQILKALALQSAVNIVTAPEVKGTLTVSLTNVPLKEALDLITTMAGVRYAQIGRTYIVTSSAKFSEAIRQMGGAKVDLTSETRVVPIFSGEGAQIKAAVLKSLPLENANGRFEIVLPSEELTLESKSVQTESDKTDSATKGTDATKADQKGTVIESKSGSSQDQKRDQYVVLIGPKPRLDEVELLVKQLDSQISNAMGIDYPTTSTIIREQYLVRGGNALDLLEALGAKNGKLGNVDIAATPKSSTSRQSIVMVGREHEVHGVIKTLSDLDSGDDVLTSLALYDVKFADPRSLREDLLAQVPGLRVIIPPASAGNPRLFKSGEAIVQASQATQEGPATAPGSGNGSAPSTSLGGQRVGGDLEKAGKISQPFTDFETSAVPMRLILRGSDDQIERAMGYLAMVDTAPRQVAIELRVVEMSKDDAIKAGIDWNILGGGAVKILRLNNSQPEGGNNAVGINFSGNGFSGDVGATLDRILTANKIIARPNILALDGRESELFVGDTVRYIKSIQSTQNGVTVTTDEVKVGVRLNVLPRVGAEGNLTMDIRPVVSFLRGFTDVPGGGKLPQTSDRVVQSTVSMMSGETIAIGGLIQEQDAKSASGIPILMDLPIVGHLFKRTNNSKIKTEVVIFLTARSLNGPANSSNKLPMEIPPAPKPKPTKTEAGGKGGN